MSIFRYRAVDARGRIVQGEGHADNALELEGRLARAGLELLETAEPRRPLFTGWQRARLTPTELINFFLQLESLLRAGVPLLDALADLRDSGPTPAARRIVADIVDRVETGSTLSEAMEAESAVFNALLVGLIRTGEVTGKLPDVLAEIVVSQKWQSELASKTKRALRYPLFVSVVILAVVAFLMVFLVPQLADFLNGIGRELPLQTRALIAVSSTVVSTWPILLALPVVAIAGFRIAHARNAALRMRTASWLLRLPMIGPIVRKVCLARFANTFALMFGSGIPVLDALRHCEDAVGNLAIADSLARARELVAQGSPVSEAFAVLEVFPPYVVRMVRVGELTGQLDNSLRNVSYFFTRDVTEQIDKLQSMIEPMLTLVMGAILGWVMIAVLGPVYDSLSMARG